MAVNRYDSPAQDRYFNTYVPLPFEQLMPVVAQRQAQVQREQDMLNKVYDDTKGIKYIADSEDERYVKDYLAKTGDLVNKYFGQDLSDPIVKQQMLSQFRGMTDRTRLQNIQTSADNWQQNLKLKAQHTAQGEYDPMIDEDPAKGWDSSNGVYQYLTPAYKNPRPSAEPYFNNMEASDWTDKEGIIHRGITRSDINRVAEAKWGDWSNTSEGRLYIKKIAKEQNIDPNDVDERKRIAMEYLKGVGEEKIHSIIAPGQAGPRAVKSAEISAFNPLKTPTINTPSEGIIGDEKYTARRVYKKAEELDSEIKSQEKALDDLIKSGANDETITQAKLNLQKIRDDHATLKSTIDAATNMVSERYKPSYDDAMNEFVVKMSKKGFSKDQATKQYKIYSDAKNIENSLQWSIANPNAPGAVSLLQQPGRFVVDVAEALSNVISAPAATIREIAEMTTDPTFRNNMKDEFAKVREGTQSIGDALKNTFKENRQYYKDNIKSVPNDKMFIFADGLDSNAKRELINTHKRISNLDNKKKNEIDEAIETGGLKSKSGVAILPIPSGVDEYGQMYVLGRDKGKVSDKSINEMTTLARQIKDNPSSFALLQESAMSDRDNKNKNKEIEDLQNSIRSADYILPTHYLPHRNEDGSYDLSFTTYHKPAKGEKSIATRVIKVRLNRQDQIESVAGLINEAGYPSTAARVANPDMERNIKSSLDSKEIKVEPYPGFGEYIIAKQQNGWKIFYPDGEPVLINKESGEELGTLNNIEDVVDYLYQVRMAVASNIPQ